MSELAAAAPSRSSHGALSFDFPSSDQPIAMHLTAMPRLLEPTVPELIEPAPVAFLPRPVSSTARAARHAVKRTFDVVCASALILILAPVLAVIALAVALSSPGSVLFRQERVGLSGGTFSMLKFRSMVTDAEARLSDLARVERREGNHVMFKMKDDPRVTRVGRLIRRFSLDELPQLFNVIGGSMSLVGPRPPLEREVVTYEQHVHRRFTVKPGITGLWQVSGRSNLSWEDTVRLDLHYVDTWSFVGDLVILLRTFKAVVVRDGAF